MSDWQLLYNVNGGDQDVTGYWRNVTGSAVLSASKVASGEGLQSPHAGVYRFTFETASTVSCAAVSPADTDNPLVYAGTRTVTADGATGNLNLVPGWSIVFAADVQADDVFEVGVGCYLDTDTNLWTRVLSVGPCLYGYQNSARDLVVKNIYGGTLTDCLMTVTNAVRVENGQSGSRPFYSLYQTGVASPVSDGNESGIAVTFANYAAGSPPTVDLLVGGVSIDVIDVSADTIMPGGVGLSCDGTTEYRFAAGSDFQGVVFSLSPILSGSDTATLYVSWGSQAVWIADDSGSFVSGPSGLTLTESGQADGTVTDDGEVAVQFRLYPTEDTYVGDFLSFNVHVQGLDGTTVVSEEFQGSFVLASGDAPLNVRISASAEKYVRPHYSEDPLNPGEYVEDDAGTYVESLTAPGSYILASVDPNLGYYEDYADYLSNNGVTFPDA